MDKVCRRKDAANGNPENPRRFRVLPKWKKAMEGFFHGQVAYTARVSSGLAPGYPWPVL